VLSVLDLQAADGPPSGRTQAKSSDRKLISGKAPASGKPGPASSRSSTGDPVLTALALAISHAVESSIGSVISTPPDRGRHPRTGGSTTDAAHEACDRAGSTRQLPTASRYCLLVGAAYRASLWSRDLSFTCRVSLPPARKPGVLPVCPAGSQRADLLLTRIVGFPGSFRPARRESDNAAQVRPTTAGQFHAASGCGLRQVTPPWPGAGSAMRPRPVPWGWTPGRG
jgi:hypothetical protein